MAFPVIFAAEMAEALGVCAAVRARMSFLVFSIHDCYQRSPIPRLCRKELREDVRQVTLSLLLFGTVVAWE